MFERSDGGEEEEEEVEEGVRRAALSNDERLSIFNGSLWSNGQDACTVKDLGTMGSWDLVTLGSIPSGASTFHLA